MTPGQTLCALRQTHRRSGLVRALVHEARTDGGKETGPFRDARVGP